MYMYTKYQNFVYYLLNITHVHMYIRKCGICATCIHVCTCICVIFGKSACSMTAVPKTRSYITSVVVENDVIPRYIYILLLCIRMYIHVLCSCTFIYMYIHCTCTCTCTCMYMYILLHIHVHVLYITGWVFRTCSHSVRECYTTYRPAVSLRYTCHVHYVHRQTI